MKKVGIVAIGTAAHNIAVVFRKNFNKEVPFILIDSHKNDLIGHRGAEIIEGSYDGYPSIFKGRLGKMLFLTGGEELFSNGDPERTLNRAKFDEAELIRAIRDFAAIIVLAGLGGGVGSGVASYIASLAKKEGIDVRALVTMPAEFEGDKRLLKANDALLKLSSQCEVTVVDDHLDKLEIVEFFTKRDAIVSEQLRKILMVLE